MKKINLALLAVLACFSTGCPYKSKYPAEKIPGAALAPALLGAWLNCKTETGNKECLRLFVYRFNEAEYYIETRSIEQTGEAARTTLETSRYKAFPARAGGTDLVDLETLRLSPGMPEEHFFFKAELLDNDKLKISCVSDEFLKTEFKSSKELQEHFSGNIAGPGFFEDVGTFERIKKN